MANLTTVATYDTIYQLESADDVQGGAGGMANKQAQALGDRDDYLLNLITGPFTSAGLSFTAFSSNLGAPFYDVGYKIVGNEVRLCGTIAVTAPVGLVNILNLPGAIIPVKQVELNCVNNTGSASVYINIVPANSAIAVSTSAGFSGYIYLDGISYRLS